MTPSDFRPGMALRDGAGHTYDLIDTRATTYAQHSQHSTTGLLVRRGDGVERWVQARTACAMMAEGKLEVIQPQGTKPDAAK